MQKDNEAKLIRQIADRHAASVGAVRVILAALKEGRGKLAQFSHPDFGGACRWAPKRTVIEDMSKQMLKARLHAIASDLNNYLHTSSDALPQATSKSGHFP
jgi:hypothetical protein